MYLFTIFLSAPHLHRCSGFSLVAARRGSSLAAERRLLTAASSLAAERRLLTAASSLAAERGLLTAASSLAAERRLLTAASPLAAERRLLTAASSLAAERGLWGTQASVVAVQGLNHPKGCRIFPDQGSNLHPLNCKVDSYLTTGPPGKPLLFVFL